MHIYAYIHAHNSHFRSQKGIMHFKPCRDVMTALLIAMETCGWPLRPVTSLPHCINVQCRYSASLLYSLLGYLWLAIFSFRYKLSCSHKSGFPTLAWIALIGQPSCHQVQWTVDCPSIASSVIGSSSFLWLYLLTNDWFITWPLLSCQNVNTCFILLIAQPTYVCVYAYMCI